MKRMELPADRQEVALIAGWLDRLDDNIFSVVLFEIVVIA
jgi:hypothetical protein